MARITKKEVAKKIQSSMNNITDNLESSYLKGLTLDELKTSLVFVQQAESVIKISCEKQYQKQR